MTETQGEPARADLRLTGAAGRTRAGASPPAQPRWEGIDLNACYEYIVGRQTLDAGFCFYSYHDWGVEEPNAPDTYAARRQSGPAGPTGAETRSRGGLARGPTGPYGSFPTLTIAHATLKALRLLEDAAAAGPERNSWRK